MGYFISTDRCFPGGWDSDLAEGKSRSIQQRIAIDIAQRWTKRP